jgi:5-methyltetrahydropteroyltriglutamate--homocysteine methyltransferase
MTHTAVLGYPRMGPARELKRALEKFWTGQSDERSLRAEAARIRGMHWKGQAAAGIDFIPCGDFSLYDHVLDTAVMLGAVPVRYAEPGGQLPLAAYFAMARGAQRDGRDVPAMEMTKWFDTNYHYIVPEIDQGQAFHLSAAPLFEQFAESKALGIKTRPVILGPVSFLSLAKSAEGKINPLSLLDSLLPVYQELLARLGQLGAEWVQVDEPVLVTDLGEPARRAIQNAYGRLANTAGPKLMLTTYFGDLRENLDLALGLPVAGLHLDLVRGPAQAQRITASPPKDLVLSLGLVDGRNIWKTDLSAAIDTAERVAAAVGDKRVIVSSSCSLLHCPEDLTAETGLDPQIAGWLSFARQKLDEVALIARALNKGRGSVAGELAENARLREDRRGSPRVRNAGVRVRLDALTPKSARRESFYADRKKKQAAAVSLPPFPTTTIGSFPQTQKVRSMRAAFKSGAVNLEEYEDFLREEIQRTVRLQEDLGLDVLVHGEFERNDMVEYFGEMLSGFVFTNNGWVQSYGSRCVKPPIIYGDVERPKPMTVRWSAYAQSLTARPMKGMLTGPVTILSWSFVRDDQPREQTCRQIALAMRDEVQDLEAAGIRLIQIDEPALREGLPLRAAEREAYLAWAVESFRIASSGVQDGTQIHTHMCYSEFNDIVAAIAAMDADVLSIESARSRMELLGAFKAFHYPNEIGPGVYDIHSPRVPSEEEIRALLAKALEVLKPEQLWVNPDCGLKTRQWKETEPALKAMVGAAHRLREEYAQAPRRAARS